MEEELINHDGGILIVSLVEIAEDLGKEGKLEDHLDDGIEAVRGESHVVHESIPVPALTVQNVLHDVLPQVEEGPEDREEAYVPHDAFEEGQVEEACHKPHKAHWSEELNLSYVPGFVERDVPVSVKEDVDQNGTNAMDHTIETVIVHSFAVALLSNEGTYFVLEFTTRLASVHLRVTHTY